MSNAELASYDLDDLDRAVVSTAAVEVQAELQIRVSLAKDWHFWTCPQTRDDCCSFALHWHPGVSAQRGTVITLHRGESIVQPMTKVGVWFGPFWVPQEYKDAVDERRRAQLRTFWNEEKARYLNRFGYPCRETGYKPDMRPIGHHRSPDVTLTTLYSDGTEGPPQRLWQLYKVGPWDPLKDEIDARVGESPEQARDRAHNELEEVQTRYERELASMRAEMEKMSGLVQGYILGSKTAEAAKPVTAGT
jgi:hypothetical protein